MAQSELLERGRSSGAIRAGAEAAAAGEWRAIVVEGPAGIGKTALVVATRVQARELGLRPLAARGSELERAFGFGVARQLLEPAAQDDSAAFAGAARYAATLLDVSLADRRRSPCPRDDRRSRAGVAERGAFDAAEAALDAADAHGPPEASGERLHGHARAERARPAAARAGRYTLGKGRYGLRYYDRDGVRRRTKEKFASKSAAFAHYRDVVEPAKTNASRRQVPLTPRALEALDALPPRLATRLLFPAPDGALLNLDKFRRREWGPAVEAAGVRRPARIYDLRSTYASNALAAGIDVFELARVMARASK